MAGSKNPLPLGMGSVKHNHPASNGILSFGKDDFDFLRNHQDIAGLRCVNEEYNYFVSTSELNKIILDNDFEEAKKRYVYQKGEAKESYLEIVKKNNIALEKIKEDIDKDYFQKVYDFQKECNETIDKLHHLIEIKSIELNSINAALETERNNMKEKYRQESANLNEAIKKIADEKNKLIDKARSEYNKAMSDADIEKENKRAVYQAKSQALLKEFVTKINVIDEQTTKTKKDFDKKIDQVKRKYYFVVFLKDKKFHYQLEQIYNASPSIDKYTNQSYKFCNIFIFFGIY